MEAPFAPGRFDVVTAFHVIEVLPDPKGTLKWDWRSSFPWRAGSAPARPGGTASSAPDPAPATGIMTAA
jgi:hypothetical protein